jgi:anti-sigma-K factor RskA
MNYLQPPGRLDALARAYAVGTLAPRASRRFKRVLASSPVAAQAVADWQRMLRVLEDGSPGAPDPRPQVWRDVQARLFGRERTAGPVDAGVGRHARALAGWAGGLGLALGALLCTVVVLMQPQWADLERSTGQAPASYVGVLSDAQGHALLATTARRHGKLLTVRLLHPVTLPPGQVLALWAWSDSDPTPRLVGRSPNVQSADIALAVPAETLLGSMTHLGVTPADAGQAAPPGPGHPFLAQGPCAKVW